MLEFPLAQYSNCMLLLGRLRRRFLGLRGFLLASLGFLTQSFGSTRSKLEFPLAQYSCSELFLGDI